MKKILLIPLLLIFSASLFAATTYQVANCSGLDCLEFTAASGQAQYPFIEQTTGYNNTQTDFGGTWLAVELTTTGIYSPYIPALQICGAPATLIERVPYSGRKYGSNTVVSGYKTTFVSTVSCPTTDVYAQGYPYGYLLDSLHIK